MTKQKSKIVSKHPLQRRTTFKKHTKKYTKVYAPYLPAIIGLVIGAVFLFPGASKNSGSVLSYATSTNSNSLLHETNDERTGNGLGRLEIDKALSSAAQAKAQDMASRNYWSHVTPDGKQPWYFINKYGYDYSEASENLAYGFTSGKDTVSGWMNSPEHRKAMLNPDISEVGFGIANSIDYQGHGPETIVVALYARPGKPGAGKVDSASYSRPAVISFGQLLSGGKLPWVNLLLGMAIGVILMYLVAKHSLKLRKKLREGERYVLKHPLMDVTLLSLLVLMIALIKTAGFIQ